MSEKIESGKVVGFSYVLKDKDGNIMEQSKAGQPLEYLHGKDNIIPGLESKLEGMHIGENKTVEVSPAEGYGEYNKELVFSVPKNNFPDDVEIQPGMQFHANSEQGAMMVTVKEVANDQVTVDANHPMAGQDLFFNVTVDTIRPATEQEMTHGHVHSNGHDH